MLFRNQFRWHSWWPVVLLLGCAESPCWAASAEVSKPCTSKSGGAGWNQGAASPWTKASLRTNGLGSTPSGEERARQKNEPAGGACLRYLAQNLVSDQKKIWTSPLHLRALNTEDKNWLAVFGIGTLGLVAADNGLMRNFGASAIAHSSSISNYALGTMVASAASFYVRGAITRDDHDRETGLLAGEAALNSVIVAETMKRAFQRPRPNAANAGTFGAGGGSFPSEHALAAWSIASVIAHEYPGPLTKLLAYGTATGIREQIRLNQPITITHPEITRFFMTISEAVSLVLQAFAVGRNGDILVLDMGNPVRVADLAKTLARLSGKPRQEFEFIGLRPGEKLFEELFYPDERVLPSGCAKVAYTESVRLAWPDLKRGLDELYVAMSLGERTSILAKLQQIVPQFSYGDGDGGAEKITFKPGALTMVHEAQLELPRLADTAQSPYRTWPVNPHPATPANPSFGPTGGGLGD